MPDRPENSLTAPKTDFAASHSMLNEVNQQHKSYLQTGVDALVDSTVGLNSTVGQEISRYAPGVLQTAALFTPGRKALAASLLLGASNEMRVGDSLQMQIAEFGLGATKGVATKALFNKLGNANIMEGSLMSVPAKGVFLGASSRALDLSLTPQTWMNKSGGIDFTAGIEKTITGSLNPTSLAMDAAIFSVAHGSTFGLNKLVGGAIDRSPALRNMAMGGTFGLTTGTTSEYMRERDAGGPISWSEIAKRGLIQGALDTVASAPGAVMGDPGLRSKLFPAKEISNIRSSANLVTALSIGALEMTGAHAGGTGKQVETNLLHGTRTVSPTEQVVDRPRNDLANGGNGSDLPGGGRVIYDEKTNTASYVFEGQMPVEKVGTPKFENDKAVNLQLSDSKPRVELIDSTGTVSGKGTIDVFGNSNLELSVPAGETLRIVIKDGSPTFKIADGSQGNIDIVNLTTNDVASQLVKDATGKPRENVRELDPLTEIFTPTEIERIHEVQAQQRALPQGTLVADAKMNISALPPEERPAAMERQAKAEAKLNEIADLVYGKGALRKEGIMHFVVGPPGAGKSSLLVGPLAEQYGALIIDSDHIKPYLDGYEKGLGTNAVHADSAEIAKRILAKGYRNHDNMINVQLGRVESALEQAAREPREMGYQKIGLHIADLPPEIASRRVYDRGEAPPDERGIRQMVDPEFALFVAGRNPLKVFEATIAKPGLIDEYSHYDTNVPYEQRARLVKASHTPPWMPPSPGQ